MPLVLFYVAFALVQLFPEVVWDSS